MKKHIPILMLILGLCGCSSMTVTETAHPDKKLRQAVQLFSKQDNPQPAEKLIIEAIEIYQSQEDNVGLADAYGTYAGFLQSPSVKAHGEEYRKNGFMNKSITFENRYDKALEYWNISLNLYLANKNYTYSPNIYFNIGQLEYKEFNNTHKACRAFETSIEYHRKYKKMNPNSTVAPDPKFESYEDYVMAAKDQVGCEQQ